MLNWAGNIEYRASGIERPSTTHELAHLVATSPRIKVLGSRHSFNRIADTTALHVSLEALPRCLDLDRARGTVTVSADLPYGEFCDYLHQHGFALHNLASLPHISVAGACATGTHGSGRRHRNLAAAVSKLEMMTAQGNHVTLTRGDADFNFAIVGLGALGIVTRITLALEPTYDVRQWVYEALPMANLEDYFEDLMQCAYSVSLFTDWRADTFSQVWLKERIGDEHAEAQELDQARMTLETNGATNAKKPLHPVDGDPDCCTQQLGEAGPWHERLPHFRMSFTPSSGKELQSEYFVPFAEAPRAIRALNELRDQIAPNLLVSEVRAIAADEFSMSPCHERESVAIHFTWRQNVESGEAILPSGLTPEVARVLEQIERALDPFDPRPHLGKLFTMTPTRLQKAYRNVTKFGECIARYDPEEKFRNEFLGEWIPGER